MIPLKRFIKAGAEVTLALVGAPDQNAVVEKVRTVTRFEVPSYVIDLKLASGKRVVSAPSWLSEGHHADLAPHRPTDGWDEANIRAWQSGSDERGAPPYDTTQFVEEPNLDDEEES